MRRRRCCGTRRASTLMGRIATAIVSVFSSELDGLLAEYEAFKRRAAVMDFDDLLFTCREVLRRYPEVRAAAGEHFSRILVDEFQDTDPCRPRSCFFWPDPTGPPVPPGRTVDCDPATSSWSAIPSKPSTVSRSRSRHLPQGAERDRGPVSRQHPSGHGEFPLETAHPRTHQRLLRGTARRATGGLRRAAGHERGRRSRLSERRQSIRRSIAEHPNRHQPRRRGSRCRRDLQP